MTESVERRSLAAACAFASLAFLPCAMRSQQAQPPAASMPSLQLPAAQAPAGPAVSTGPTLTLADAERMAIEHNPNISVARLIALAQAQVTREVRSAELPTVQGDLTAVGAHENSRITAGALNNPSIYDRAAGGLTVSQLITDFGRTHNLVRSAQSNAEAQLENERATELDITLTVDQAFYQALTSQAVLKVAEATVNQRQATVDQVGALAKQKLRSDLDLSFSDVQLSQAKLLLLDAQSDAAGAMASLNAVLGSERDQQYTLVDETTANPEPPPQDAEALLPTAFTARPDLAALNSSYTAARQFSTAEHDLWMPTVSALAAVGGAPVRADQIQSSWYGAAGANIGIPVFNGFLYNARAQEAKLRANAAGERVRNLRDVIARDLRTAVLNAQNAFERIGVTQEMLNEANLALDLSQERYKIGLSGIVELTQAQLAQTQAEIDYANARYAYQTALAVVRFQTGQ
jgi:outer membrane protein